MKLDQPQIAFVFFRLLAAGLLFWAFARHPIGYYTLLRLVVCATAAYGAYTSLQIKQSLWACVMGVVIILFNPFLTIHLKRHDWFYIDPSVAILFLLSVPLLYLAQTRQKSGVV